MGSEGGQEREEMGEEETGTERRQAYKEGTVNQWPSDSCQFNQSDRCPGSQGGRVSERWKDR